MELLVVGECFSHKDNGVPFSDGNGKMLKALMNSQGLSPDKATFINLFNETPPRGAGPDSFFGSKDKSLKHIRYYKKGKYIDRNYWHHVETCRSYIAAHKPNLVLAVGDAVLWALTTESKIDFARGRVHYGNSALPTQKILPVYAPRMVQSNWTLRPILMADLHKAVREMQFPEIRRPAHRIHMHPTLDDLEHFLDEYIVPSPTLSVDIETREKTITCIGFAPSEDNVIVVPFYSEDAPRKNYWPTVQKEVFAWKWVQRVLNMGKRVKGQNFQYDMQYLWRMGITCPSFSDDTMILHHSLQPEMKKGLGFQASIYTDEPPWKFMHKTKSSDKSGKKLDNE